MTDQNEKRIITVPTAQEVAAINTKEDALKLIADLETEMTDAFAGVKKAVEGKIKEIEDMEITWAKEFRKDNGVSWQLALTGLGLLVVILLRVLAL